MKKKVTAPLTYDPGKGRPKEHLAYLNWQEMQALKRINGNNQERGPKGLPSFPPNDAIGSSSKASSSKSSGSKASTSKSTGSYTGGGKMGKSSSQVGAQKASQQGSNLGAQKSSSQASKSPSGKPSAGAAKASQAAEQKAQKAGAQKASAPKAPAAKSGIKSLNVGPMGTPVSVKTGGTQIKGAIKSVQQAAPAPKAPTRTVSPAGLFGPQNYTGTYNPKTGKYDARPVANTTPAVKAPINKYEALRAYKGPYGPEMYSALGSPVEQAMLTGRPLAETPRPQPVAMDPSIRGRLEEANKNYRTVQSGPYVGKVYSDPDIKGRTIGDTISDYAGSAYDAVNRGIRSIGSMLPSGPVPGTMTTNVPGLRYSPDVQQDVSGTISDYVGSAYDTVAGGLKAIGDALPPNVFSTRPPDTFTDRIGPTLKYGAPIGPQRPVKSQSVYKTPQPPAEAMYGAPYSRLGLPNERMLYNTSPATLERMEKVFNKAPEVSPEGYGYAVDQQRMADEIRALMERDVETFEGPKAPSYPFSNFASESLPPGYRDRYLKSPTLNIQPMGMATEPEEKILSVEDMPEETPFGLTGKDARKAAKAAKIPASVYNQPGFTDDVDQLGIGVTAPDAFSATDMAKLHARAYGSAYLTPAERRQATVTKGILRGGQAVLNATVPLSGTAAKGAGKLLGAEPVETFLGRPSYEQGYLRDLARAENIRYGRDPLGRESYTTTDGQTVNAPVTGGIGGGRSSDERPTTGGISNLPTATPTTPSTEPTTTSGTRPYIYYQWDLGMNVPSQSDPNYTQYQKYLSDRAARRAALGMA